MTGYLYIRLRESNLYLLYTLQRTISEKIVIDNKWTVDGEVTDRSILSDELAAFCAKYPIYSVKKMKDTMASTRIQNDGEHACQPIPKHTHIYDPSTTFSSSERKCVFNNLNCYFPL